MNTIENMFKIFESLGCSMSLRSLGCSTLGAMSEEQGEKIHRDIEAGGMGLLDGAQGPDKCNTQERKFKTKGQEK